jgi:hypothetical protein
MRFYSRLQESKGSRVNSSSASASIALMLLIATGLFTTLGDIDGLPSTVGFNGIAAL